MEVRIEKICENNLATIYRYTVAPEPSRTNIAEDMLSSAIARYREEGRTHNIYYEEGNPHDVLVVEYLG